MITIISGPRNSGKSALAEGMRMRGTMPPISRNTMMLNFSSPSAQLLSDLQKSCLSSLDVIIVGLDPQPMLEACKRQQIEVDRHISIVPGWMAGEKIHMAISATPKPGGWNYENPVPLNEITMDTSTVISSPLSDGADAIISITVRKQNHSSPQALYHRKPSSSKLEIIFNRLNPSV